MHVCMCVCALSLIHEHSSAQESYSRLHSKTRSPPSAIIADNIHNLFSNAIELEVELTYFMGFSSLLITLNAVFALYLSPEYDKIQLTCAPILRYYQYYHIRRGFSFYHLYSWRAQQPTAMAIRGTRGCMWCAAHLHCLSNTMSSIYKTSIGHKDSSESLKADKPKQTIHTIHILKSKTIFSCKPESSRRQKQ